MKRLITLGLLLLSGCAIQPAFAQTHTIDFTKVLLGSDEKPILQQQTDPKVKPEPTTLGDVAIGALTTLTQDDQRLTGEEKFKMDVLARKIYHAKSAALTVDDIKLIKDRIGKLYFPNVVGAAWRLLDPNQH
ncbi:MAG: hypothetical protein ACRDHZ_00490 [Ktedonobacteraceae bacterium]